MKTKPQFIGIGAPKAATTWLHNCLASHPQLYLPPAKDKGFFDYLDPIDQRMDEYFRLFEGGRTDQLPGEISVVYLDSPRAPERIARHLPDVKLFASLRSPLEQIHSHYWHLKRQNFHIWPANVNDLPRNLIEAVERFPERLIKPALYHRHLSDWLTVFRQEQLHIIFYDDIVSNPLGTVQGLFEFLGVNPDHIPPAVGRQSSDDRRGVSPRAGLLAGGYPFIYDKLNRYAYHPLKRSIGWERANRVKDVLRIRQMMERFFFRTGYPPLSRRERSALVALVRDDVAALQELTHRDLSHWLRG